MAKHSRMLLDMLQRDVLAYKQHAQDSAWADISHLIATKPFLVRATVLTPYDCSPASPLVSLLDSEDYSHYRLVANAVAVTDPALGDTTQLRSQLSLSTGPQLSHVISHLMHTARARNAQIQSQDMPPDVPTSYQEDVEKAYAFIVGVLGKCLAGDERWELAKLSKWLMEAPWIMVQAAQRFVVPCELVYDIDEDLEQGKPVSHLQSTMFIFTNTLSIFVLSHN